MRVLAVVVLAACIAASCGMRRFVAVAGEPYRLRNPKGIETPFPDLLNPFGDLGNGWVDLSEAIIVIVTAAYHEPGYSTKGVAGYLGTEASTYRVMRGGEMRQTDLKILPSRPASSPPVTSFFQQEAQRRAFHRLFLQVVVNKKSGESSPVILSTRTRADLLKLSERMNLDAAGVCAEGHCSVFPPNISVSLAMEITVNGKPQSVAWGSSLLNVVGTRKEFALFRKYKGRETPVIVDVNDPQAMRMPLIPGDSLRW